MKLNPIPNFLLCVSLLGLLPASQIQGQDQTISPTPENPVPSDSSTFAYAIPPDRGAAALRDSLRKLQTRASFLMITAHPDDEDGGVLTYESRYTGADTSLLTLNRGEGGQNAMSSNYWDELGLVRTQELLAADRYYGVHQYWTRVADFGFSKTLEESLAEWGHDRVLYDVVRVVRMTRPLIVTAVFVGSVSDGHGQHQVSGVMAQEAFKAAGDPNVFPDQIRAGLRPWSPLKVYARLPFARVTSEGIYDYATGHWSSPVRFRNYVDGSWIEGTPKANVSVPVGRYDGLYGLSSFQLGRQGLNEQKSQNGGVGLPLPGPVTSSYHLYGSRVAAASDGHGADKPADFYAGIDLSLEGIASYAPAAQQGEWRTRLAALEANVAKAAENFSAEDPAKIAPILADGLAQTNGLLDALAKSNLPDDAQYNMAHELKIKQQQFNDALIEALGLNILANVSSAGAQANDVQPSFQVAIPGQKFNVSLHVANQGHEPVELTHVTLDTAGDKGWSVTPVKPSPGTLGGGETCTLILSVSVPEHPALTRPYFSRPTVEQPYYDIDDPRFLNLSTAPYPLTAKLTLAYHGVEIHTENTVQTVHRVTGPGPVLDPLLVAAPVSVWVSPAAGVVPLTSKVVHLSVTLHSNVKGPAKGTIHLELPPGWTSTPAAADFSTAKDGDEQNLAFEIVPKDVHPQPYTIRAVAEYDGKEFTEGYRMVGYTGLRPYPYYREASYRTTGVDLRVPAGLKIGYIMGTGDDVPDSLKDLGVQVDFLSPEDISTGDLSNYDVIVVGIRAYAVRPEIRTFNGRLLNYVKQGGVLLVQYQTPEFDHDYGPYPFSLGDNPEKVVEERSPVALLRPDDPVFNWPNKITSGDFSGWVEERGHDFLDKWDPKYVALTEVHDQDQEPQKGGLLYTRYGRGLYVYAAYAFYRQLPEGIPGAFRIFANLLSMGKNPAFSTGK